MSFAIVAPLFYLVVGMLMHRLPHNFKGHFSAFLNQWVIPLIIIYSIATYRFGTLMIMIAMMVMMTIMYLISHFFTSDPVKSLCFSYSNLGRLGLPVASALFEDNAIHIFLAAYVASVLLGNSVGPILMSNQKTIGKQLLDSLRLPPVWALIIGLLLIPFGAEIKASWHVIYSLLKFLLSALGMAVLGMWLPTVKFTKTDIKSITQFWLIRCLTACLLITVFIQLCSIQHISLVIDNQPVLYLLCLLPPAINVMLLETVHLETGRSVPFIACGTCISIVAIGVYAVAIICLRI